MGELIARRSRLPLVLWIASAIFIVYGTTIPFNFVHDWQSVHDHLARVTWNPILSPDTGRRVSIPDFTGNILLFTPFGALGMWSLARPRSLIARMLLLAAASFALSTLVETVQLFTFGRTTSIADVMANSMGGLLGAVAALLVATTAEGALRVVTASGMTDARSFYPLLIAAIVMCAGAWEPFDVTLDVGSVASKVRVFVHDPLQLGAFVDEGVSLLQHALFTAALVVWLQETGVGAAAAIAAAIGGTAAVGLEASQLFIAARMPGAWDAAVAVGGALVGVVAGLAFQNASRRSAWWTAIFGVTAIGMAMQQLSPFERASELRPFQWIPFLNYYTFTTSETVSHSAELLLGYFPLGFATTLATRAPRTRVPAAVLSALAIAMPVEYLQRLVGGRYPDVTDVALSVAGAWLGAWFATEGWRLFRAEAQIISSSRPAVREAS